MFTTCSLHVHYMFTICSLYVHYIFTIYHDEYVTLSVDISASLFRVTSNPSLRYTNTQKLNSRYQELEPTHLLSHLYVPGGFLPHL